MASDRARDSFDPARKWRGLVAQQGRVTLEADWNEAAAIQAQSDRLSELDVIGPLGSPHGGYGVTADGSGSPPSSPPGSGWGPLTVGQGTVYVGGTRLDLDQDCQLDGTPQPDWLDQSTSTVWLAPEAAPSSAPTSPPAAPNELVYLLAVEQEVSALEVPELADVALGGPDTMQRLRVLQRFVRWPTFSADCTLAWAEVQAAWQTIGLNFDRTTMLLGSAAQLEVSFDPVQPSTSACEPAATGGYLGPENQMIRVQVASVDPDTGVPTIVWGFDNATFLYQLSAAGSGSSGFVLTFAKNPVDNYHYPQAGQAVEFLRDAAAVSPTDDGNPPFGYIASGSGFVTTVTTPYDPSFMTLGVADQPPADYLATSATPQLYLRVWQGTAEAPPGTPVELATAGVSTGIQVTLTSSSGSFHPGDFWYLSVRPSVPNQVYPARIAASPQPPDGPRVWACPVAFVAWTAGEVPPQITSCIPHFDNLVELTGKGGGCCTLSVSPADLEDGASLAQLIAAHLGSEELQVCFAPGSYQLTEPLVLGPEYSGISLKACGPGVVFQAPVDPGTDFVLGLIVIYGAQQVSITGIDFKLPVVTIQVSQNSFAALAKADTTNANRAVLEAFANVVSVALGISAADATDLQVSGCAFDLPEFDKETSLFSAGVLAGGVMTGFQLADCTFTRPSPTIVPFYDLAAGQAAAAPYQLTFGFLQASSQAASTSLLNDATIEDCLFQGVTVPALAMDHLGDLRLRDNTVRDCYGGFWLYALPEQNGRLLFDILPVGNAALRSEFASAGVIALGDAIPLIASAMVRVLPQRPPTGSRWTPGVITAPDEAAMARLAASVRAFFSLLSARPAAAPAVSSPPSAARARVSRSTRAFPVLTNLLNSLGSAKQAGPAAADTGTSTALRLTANGLQVDSVVAAPNTYSGAALLVVDMGATPGSAVVYGNRLRNRFPGGGATALLSGLGDVAVSGNVMANEEPPKTGTGYTYSLSLQAVRTTLPAPPVAAAGNLFISPVNLPVQSGLPTWAAINTIMNYP
jgi:hypothetical protein